MNNVYKTIKDCIENDHELSYAYITNKDMFDLVRSLEVAKTNEDAIKHLVSGYLKLLKAKLQGV